MYGSYSSSGLDSLYGSYGSYGSGYGSSSNALNQLQGAATTANNIQSWALPAIIISLIAAVLIFFIFLSKKNEGKFKGFLGWMYDFLSFKKLAVEAILKILYITLALYITIMSFTVIRLNFGTFLLMLIGGNILIRVIYELALVLLIVCRNTSEINAKLTKKDE